MEKPDEEVKKAYGFARRMSKRFVETHPRPVYHLDEDDYIQEAIIAWMEKKHIPYRLVDAYRKAAPVGRRSWPQDGKVHDTFPLDTVTELFTSSGDTEEGAEKLIKLKIIQEIVNNMADPRQQVIIIMRYVADMPLIDIASGLGISRSYTSKLHREALDHIKKEVEKRGDY